MREELSVLVDGHLLTTQTHPHPVTFRYVFVGSDSSGAAYGQMKDVIFKNVRVWDSPDGGRISAAARR